MKKTLTILLLFIITAVLLSTCGGSSNKCGACNGSGYYQKKTCPICKGSGHSSYDPYKQYKRIHN